MLILLIDIMKDSGSRVLCRIVVVVLLPSFVVWWCHDAHIVVARSRYKVDMKVEYHLSLVRYMHSGQYCLLECTLGNRHARRSFNGDDRTTTTYYL